LNSVIVGTYINQLHLLQLSKILVVPFSAALEWSKLGTRVDKKKAAAIVLVLLGVGLA
jgi:hypothetical protein